MILPEQKILFIDISKTGTNSVCNALGLAFGIPACHTGRRHHSITNLWLDTAHITREMVRDYFTFTFVRNPYERLVSLWSGHSGRWRYPNLVDYVVAIQPPEWSGLETRRFAYAWMPMARWLGAEKKPISPDVNFIGRYENLQADYDKLCRMLGVRPTKLPHMKKDKRERAHYSTYYDDKALELTTNYYARDLELFGYEFEDRR